MAESDCTTQGTFWTVPPEKRCPKCKTWKPFDCFGKVKGKTRSYCRECHASYMNNPDIRTEKMCANCGVIKPTVEFNRLGLRFQPCCRECGKERMRERNARLKATGENVRINKEDYWRRRRWVALKSKYGITREEYAKMAQEQGGCCAICKMPEQEHWCDDVLQLAVDHDHKTGKVRGLLCRMCNIGIGRFRENIDVLKNAIDYLRLHSEEG